MIYLLDANAFIQAHRTYYHMNICPGYWDWLDHQNGLGIVQSIDWVYEELVDGNDKLVEWAKARKPFFKESSDASTQENFAAVAEHVVDIPNMVNGASEEFLDGADPWLIAMAMNSNNYKIVTNEGFKPEIRRKILIPNVCEHFNVQYMGVVEFLKELEAKFVMSAP